MPLQAIKTNQMRKIEFNVPTEIITQFIEEMTERNLSNSITGLTEEDEVIIEIEYDKTETDEVDQLDEILEKLCSGIQEEEEETEDDDE